MNPTVIKSYFNLIIRLNTFQLNLQLFRLFIPSGCSGNLGHISCTFLGMLGNRNFSYFLLVLWIVINYLFFGWKHLKCFLLIDFLLFFLFFILFVFILFVVIFIIIFLLLRHLDQLFYLVFDSFLFCDLRFFIFLLLFFNCLNLNLIFFR